MLIIMCLVKYVHVLGFEINLCHCIAHVYTQTLCFLRRICTLVSVLPRSVSEARGSLSLIHVCSSSTSWRNWCSLRESSNCWWRLAIGSSNWQYLQQASFWNLKLEWHYAIGGNPSLLFIAKLYGTVHCKSYFLKDGMLAGPFMLIHCSWISLYVCYYVTSFWIAEFKEA